MRFLYILRARKGTACEKKVIRTTIEKNDIISEKKQEFGAVFR